MEAANRAAHLTVQSDHLCLLTVRTWAPVSQDAPTLRLFLLKVQAARIVWGFRVARVLWDNFSQSHLDHANSGGLSLPFYLSSPTLWLCQSMWGQRGPAAHPCSHQGSCPLAQSWRR